MEARRVPVPQYDPLMKVLEVQSKLGPTVMVDGICDRIHSSWQVEFKLIDSISAFSTEHQWVTAELERCPQTLANGERMYFNIKNMPKSESDQRFVLRLMVNNAPAGRLVHNAFVKGCKLTAAEAEAAEKVGLKVLKVEEEDASTKREQKNEQQQQRRKQQRQQRRQSQPCKRTDLCGRQYEEDGKRGVIIKLGIDGVYQVRFEDGTLRRSAYERVLKNLVKKEDEVKLTSLSVVPARKGKEAQNRQLIVIDDDDDEDDDDDDEVDEDEDEDEDEEGEGEGDEDDDDDEEEEEDNDDDNDDDYEEVGGGKRSEVASASDLDDADPPLPTTTRARSNKDKRGRYSKNTTSQDNKRGWRERENTQEYKKLRRNFVGRQVYEPFPNYRGKGETFWLRGNVVRLLDNGDYVVKFENGAIEERRFSKVRESLVTIGHEEELNETAASPTSSHLSSSPVMASTRSVKRKLDEVRDGDGRDAEAEVDVDVDADSVADDYADANEDDEDDEDDDGGRAEQEQRETTPRSAGSGWGGARVAGQSSKSSKRASASSAKRTRPMPASPSRGATAEFLLASIQQGMSQCDSEWDSIAAKMLANTDVNELVKLSRTMTLNAEKREKLSERLRKFLLEAEGEAERRL